MATQDVATPLGAFLRGFQGAQARAQQREQQATENELTQQLRQIQLLNAQRQLAEASKTPEQRLAEQIKEAFAVDALKRGALVQAPVGLEGESIALPSAINQTAAQLDAANTFAPALQTTPLSITTGQPEQPSLSDALSQIVIPQVAAATPSFNIPTAANKGFETPSPITGFNVSEEASRQKTAQGFEKLMQEEQIKSRFAKGNKKALGLTPDGKGVVIQDASTGDISVEAIPGGGGIAPLPGTGAKSSGGLTISQQNSELAKATKAGLDPEKFRDPTSKQIDFQALAIERGRAEGEAVSAANVIKNARLAASAAKGSKPTVSQENFQLYGNRMDQADKVLSDLAEKGFDPTSIGTEGLTGQWLPNLLKGSDRQAYEQAQRNFINAVLRKESGAVISDSEFENARAQYFPQPGDSSDLLAQKSETRKLVIDEFKRLGGSGANPSTASSVTNAPTTSGKAISTKSGNKFQLAQ